jgi:hypothetical protein
MLTHITENLIASSQVFAFQQVNKLAQKHYYTTKCIIPAVCVADAAIETAKYPTKAIENLAVGLINTCGFLFSNKCSIEDANQNLEEVKINTLTGIAMALLFPFNLFELLRTNMSDPKHAHSCNKQAEEQANLPMISTNINRIKEALQPEINVNLLSAVIDLLTNSSCSEYILDFVNISDLVNVNSGIVNNRSEKDLRNSLNTCMFTLGDTGASISFLYKNPEIISLAGQSKLAPTSVRIVQSKTSSTICKDSEQHEKQRRWSDQKITQEHIYSIR